MRISINNTWVSKILSRFYKYCIIALFVLIAQNIENHLLANTDIFDFL